MKIVFDEEKIIIGEKEILYSDFEKERGYEKMIELLEICVNNKNISLECTEKCTPFGKKIKEIIDNELKE